MDKEGEKPDEEIGPTYSSKVDCGLVEWVKCDILR